MESHESIVHIWDRSIVYGEYSLIMKIKLIEIVAVLVHVIYRERGMLFIIYICVELELLLLLT